MKKLTILFLMLIFLTLFSQNKASGGPDTFGYTWIDSDEAGGPTYAWFEISSLGTSLVLSDDQISSSISMGLTVGYYGNDFSSIKICSNGFLSFTDTSTDYTQDPIPSASAPNNMIAPFWSDIKSANVYHYYDSANSRFIVQYENVSQWSGGSGNTFQVMIYSNGNIIFQYKEMLGLMADCSVGIENDTGTDGLQVTFNSGYLNNDLAVKFIKPSLIGATCDISTSSLDYGNIDVGNISNQTFTISNLHSGEILNGQIKTIDGYTVSKETKKIDLRSKGIDSLFFEIPPSDSIVFNLLFEPVAEQFYNGSISITTSDTLAATNSISVTGQGINPDISISQIDSIITQSLQDNSVDNLFNIKNNGLGELDYSISIYYDYGSKLVNKGLGGPDSYGYYWEDSDEATGPTYNWYDISGLGNTLNLEDEDVSGNIFLGFNFDFYGFEYDSVKIYSNGYLNFAAEKIEYTNTMLPDPEVPNGLISGYWADLNPESQGDIYYYYDGSNNRFIVQYQNVINYNETTENTFQMILNSDGSIEYQYNTIHNTDASLNSYDYTVGIENIDGTDGTQISYNTAYLKNSFAIKIVPGIKWLSVLPSNGTILYNDSLQITATCNSAGLEVGKYYGDINITSNDPDTPNYTIPVEFLVYGITSPENVVTSIVGNTIKLDWDIVPYATSYVVYSSLDPYGTYAVDSSGSLNGESWSTSMTENKKFFYVISVDSKTKITETIMVE